MPGAVEKIVDRAFEIGMFQHRGEILPFAEWLAPRWPHHVIEIGALHGGTSYLLGKLSTGRMISVDLPDGRFGGKDHGYDRRKCWERFNMLTAELGAKRYYGVMGDSHSRDTFNGVAARLNMPADVLFIDGDHTLGGVTADFLDYRALVKPGGVIVFHDINDTPRHRADGCLVHELWKTLEGEERLEWSVGGEWGGIGAIRRSALY